MYNPAVRKNKRSCAYRTPCGRAVHLRPERRGFPRDPVKDPYAGINQPTVFAAWHWQNYPYYGSSVTSYKPAETSEVSFKVELKEDNAWHGYYGSNQILWLGNRITLGACVASSERYYTGYTDGNGVYQTGDMNANEGIWHTLKRKDSHDQWGNFLNMKEANYPSYNWNMSTDSEFDPYIFDNTRFHAYKARNNGGGGWVKSKAVGYAEAHVFNPEDVPILHQKPLITPGSAWTPTTQIRASGGRQRI